MEASIATAGDPILDPAPVLIEDDQMSDWANSQYIDKYAARDENGEPTEVWPDTAYRVVRHVLGTLGYTDKDPEFQALVRFISQRKFIPGGRYLSNAGQIYHQVNNCFLYRCEDTREGWADVIRKGILALSSGGGVGVVWSDVRAYGTPLKRTKGISTGPLSPAKMLNEVAREVMAGNRRSAIWGGLHWWHPDIFDWISVKDWSDDIKALKEKDWQFTAPLDMTNISVILDSDFFTAYYNPQHSMHEHAQRVYWEATAHMLKHGEPGFSIDVGPNAKENLRNACTEITSEDDSDVCNLGSINLSRVESVQELQEIVKLGTLFLLAGTVYSDIPHAEVEVTRSRNRRLGLGLMGIHEWLVRRGYTYEVVPELREWLEVYATSTEVAAEWADKHKLSRPVKTRAIAPNGTIGIIGETTTSAEPMFCAAYKRRYIEDGKLKYQYVVDPTAVKLDNLGIDPDSIESAYTLALNPEKRVKFQADLQDYIDHGIASTINLPEPVTDPEEVQWFGNMLIDYLPRLRGITCYPDGARSGQPLTAVTYQEAAGKEGVAFEEASANAACASGVCGV